MTRVERAIVWKRSDFRESSRLITLVTPEHGKLVVLAKGAHRQGSVCLGRIDLFNLLDVTLSRGTLPLLSRVRLVHEPRPLRQPIRYRAASYLAELFDAGFLGGHPAPELFELLDGSLKLVERCPAAALPQILTGVELRFLDYLGQRPSLTSCSQCGTAAGETPLFPAARGLSCARHPQDPWSSGAAVPPVAPAGLQWLDSLARAPGRAWPGLPPAPPGITALVGRWVAQALERRPRHRPAAFGREGRGWVTHGSG